MSRRAARAAWALSGGLALALAGALAPATSAYADGAGAFERECVMAWSKAFPNRPVAQHRELCRCGLAASLRAGVTDAELSAEAARVRRDPAGATPDDRIRGAVDQCLNDMLAAASRAPASGPPEKKR